MPTIDPASLANPPRPIRGGFGGFGEWFGRLFILPHFCVGVVSLGVMAFMILAALFPTNVPGSIIASSVSTSQKGGTYYSIEYTFEVQGTRFTEKQSVDQGVYQRFQDVNSLTPDQRKVEVATFAIGPKRTSSVPALSKSQLPVWAFFLLWCTIWNSVVGVFIYQLWIKPFRLRSLFRNGMPAVGMVTSKRVSRGKTTSYYVSYTFQNPLSGQELTSECDASSAAWNSLNEGDIVTVLFMPQNPRRNVAIDACPANITFIE